MKTKALIPALAVALLLVGAATAQAEVVIRQRRERPGGRLRASRGRPHRLRLHHADPWPRRPRHHHRPRSDAASRASLLAAHRAGLHRGAGRPRRRAGGARRPAPAERQDDRADRGTSTTDGADQAEAARAVLQATADNPIWEYAAAPFAFSFAPGQIAVNNDIVVVQGDHSAYVSAMQPPVRTSAAGVAASGTPYPGQRDVPRRRRNSCRSRWARVAPPTCRAPTTPTARSPERSPRRFTTP